MFSRLFFCAALAIPGIAQDSRAIPSVEGTVVTDEPLGGNHLIVTLTDTVYHRELARAFVRGDGGFEFRNVAMGIYCLELGVQGGDTMEQQMVNIEGGSEPLEIRLPSRGNKAVGGGTVSVQQLQHPISPKSQKIFEAAQKASAQGDYLKEIEILRRALNDAAAAPNARMNIGVAYLRAGQASQAIPELQEAARLMPQNAVAHTNLAYALLLTERLDASEAECRRALQLDRNNSKARWVMGSILLRQGAHEQEAVADLQFASREIPKARMILAQFYERSGQKDAAVRELRAFLPQASGADRANVERWLSSLSK